MAKEIVRTDDASVVDSGTSVVESRVYRGGSRSSLEPYQQLALCRELAVGDLTKTALGDKYGMTQQGITAFSIRNADKIDDIRLHMADQFAGLPLARKENRLAAYEREVQVLNDHKDGAHHLFSMARQSAYRNIAEELGQLPPRASVTIVPVQNVVYGVSDDDI